MTPFEGVPPFQTEPQTPNTPPSPEQPVNNEKERLLSLIHARIQQNNLDVVSDSISETDRAIGIYGIIDQVLFEQGIEKEDGENIALALRFSIQKELGLPLASMLKN